MTDRGKFGWTFNDGGNSDQLFLDNDEINHVMTTGEPMCVVNYSVWNRRGYGELYIDHTDREQRYGHTNWDEAYALVIVGDAVFVTKADVEHMLRVRAWL